MFSFSQEFRSVYRAIKKSIVSSNKMYLLNISFCLTCKLHTPKRRKYSASVDMPKLRFASPISQSANDFFLFIFYLKKKTWGREFSLTCSVDFFMLSPQNKPAFLALILPSFISLNPFVTFSNRCNPILAVTTGESMSIPGSTPTLSVIYRKCSHAKQAVHTKSSRL